MKLNKERETEVLQAYETYFENYIKGNTKAIDSLLDEEYNQIGSAESEVFFNKKDAMQFIRDTIDQVAGKTEMRNRVLRVDRLKEYFLVTDLFDIYAQTEEDWSFYAKFRASTLMEKKEGAWKFIHQHSSMPDTRTQEGENIAIEKISAENLQLREAVKRRTTELEHKNRELQIEAALERVRAGAMAMHRSDELNQLIGTIFHELTGLDMILTRAALYLIEPETKSSRWWMANSEAPAKPMNYMIPYHDHAPYLAWLEGWQKRELKWAYNLKGKIKKDWDKFLFSKSELSQLPDFIIEGMKSPEHVIITASFNNFGSLSLATLEPLPDNQLDILIRFSKVFEQTYTRFLDLQKAEAQAREAEIELSLERVRARTMAMHHSDELFETSTFLLEELRALGQSDIKGLLGIGLIDEESKLFKSYISGAGGPVSKDRLVVPCDEHRLMADSYKAWKQAKRDKDAAQSLSRIVPKNQLKGWITKLDEYSKGMHEHALVDNEMLKVADSLLQFPKWTFEDFFFNQGMIFYQNVDPLSEYSRSILQRFAKVFEQTYTRFLDLQKAEAQAREAQIEVALERIRARALAMHSSEELTEVAQVLREQMGELGQPELLASIVHIYPKNSETFDSWFAFRPPNQQDSKVIHGKACFRKDATSLSRKWYAKYLSEDTEYTIKTTGAELAEWVEHRNKIIPDIVKYFGDRSPKSICFYFCDFSGGSLILSSNEETSAEAKELLSRAAKVFDLAYRRYIDLQKAEAQAREAEIQLALERVRARAMAMHTSEELEDVANVLREQMGLLGQTELIGTVVELYEKHPKHIESWHAFRPAGEPDTKMVTGVVLFEKNSGAVIREMIKRYQGPQKQYTIEAGGDKIKEWYKVLQQVVPEVKNVLIPKKEFYHCADFSGGTLLLASRKEPSTEAKDLLMRSSSVFDLAYRRFLDLQKAEAQAREAQIEAGLERVRSRTMAMHKSEELGEVAVLLYQELMSLGMTPFFNCGYVEVDEKNNMQHCWFTTADGKFLEPFHLPLTGEINFDNRYENWKKRVPVFRQVVGGKSLKKHMEFLFPVLGSKEVEEIIRTQFPDPTIFYCGNFSDGYLSIVTGTSLTVDDENLLARFTNVFEMTYKRFLDLQKAEAQAREAQIEAALEKVRSRSLAMHQANELGEVVTVIVEKLKDLGVVLDANGVILCTYFKESRDVLHWIVSPDFSIAGSYLLPYFDHPIFSDAWESKESGVDYFSKAFTVEEKNSFFEYAFKYSDYKNFPEEFKQWVFQNDKHILSFAWQKNSAILIPSHTGVVPTADEVKILKRFAKVFEQSYVRFLDLQKAEAQAREAQIEAGLERLRSRSMAMHKSDELIETATVLYKELTKLGIPPFSTGFVLVDEENSKQEVWFSAQGGEGYMTRFHLPLTGDPVLDKRYRSWKNKEIIFHEKVSGKKLRKHLEFVAPYFGTLEAEEEAQKFPDTVVFYCSYFPQGYLHVLSETILDSDQESIMKRFTKVFAMTYTRFLDLQKAEEQAREAQIEAALERVRSRTMAMHQSSELQEVINRLLFEFESLGIITDASFILTAFDDKERNGLYVWVANKDGSYAQKVFTPYLDHSPHQKFYDALKSRQKFYTGLFSKKEKNRYFKFAFKNSPQLGAIPGQRKQFILDGTGWAWSAVILNHLVLCIQRYNLQKFSDTDNEIVKRFGGVLNQTYTRFLDLKKAEAQAREAQIEASLERVRSRSMAMHKSEELLEVITVVSQQLQLLNLKFNTVSFATVNQEHDYKFWFAVMGDPNPLYIQVPYLKNPMYDRMKEVLASGSDFYADTLTPEENRAWHEHMFTHADLSFLSEETKENILRSGYARSIAITPGIMLIVSNYSARTYTDDENDIIKRFAAVFQQSYTRFLDLKKAEAQAREARIEVALERVRSRSMAMQNSEELNTVMLTIFEEATSLGLQTIRGAIWIFNPTDKSITWVAVNPESKSGPKSYHIPYLDHPVNNDYWKMWDERKESIVYELSGEKKSTYDEALLTYSELSQLPEEVKSSMRGRKKSYLTSSFKDFGALIFTSLEPPETETISLVERFSKVFDQSYTRFKDIQQGELREKEAVRQASLDRVRAEIASMRTTKDLERITPLIWRELRTLDVPFFRCGVFIMNDETKTAKVYLSDQTGKSLAVWESAYDKVPMISASAQHWREQKIYLEEWDQKQFMSLTKSLLDQKLIDDPKHYQSGETAPEHLILQLVPFTQGMLYVGSDTYLDDDQLELVQALAKAFSIAYARYEDFNELENAKNKVEITLSELKSTQAQLIQAEKMASLGELTAGIAHEIQNPLNFVNNFSEVSGELVDEMNEELEGGNLEEVKAITKDLKQNLEKINHHGQRASSIVKGMLEHSGTGTRQKELTDINMLADEYLRLSYHGLRAKDKSFNAEIKAELDPSLPKVMVVGQDIGRVMLNLINNAFYAVSEKASRLSDPEHSEGVVSKDYKPLVTITTKQKDKHLEIRVKDNADGIPPEIVNKIFQPFFTTKPTGSGTGLGLSLSYDIVKAHGGELIVDSTEGKGSEFIIQLPA